MKQFIVSGQADLSSPGVGAITLSKNRIFCTGTLVAPRLVLTAAHCVLAALQTGPENIFFRIDWRDSGGGFRSEYFQVQRAVSLPEYAAGQTIPAFDLGLLILRTPVTSASPLSVLRGPMDPKWSGQPAKVMGYGLIQTRPSEQATNEKQSAEIPITTIDKQTFVQWDKKSMKSACHGDSGGPVLLKAFGRVQIIGVISAPYRATPSSTSNRTYCDGGSIATRVDVHLNFLRPYLQKYNSGLLSCQSSKECSPCGDCPAGNGLRNCRAFAVTTKSSTCKPCTSKQDCGEGVCQRFEDGFRCVQPCTSSSCCPSSFFCDTPKSSVVSGQKVCLPLGSTCPPVVCQSDSECGLDGVCQQSRCRSKTVARHGKYCHPCYSTKQCGQGNLCLNSVSAMGHCLQACTKGGLCPSGSKCTQVAPGLQQCVPQEGCFPTCSNAGQCPVGTACREGVCLRKGGGQRGDPCDSKRTCASDFACVLEGKKGRCMRRCGPPKGAAGEPCQRGQCAPGLTCIPIPGNRDVCLQTCTSSCQVGLCLQISARQKACICRSHQECPQEHVCNQGVLGGFGDGACVPQSSFARPCRPGTECRPNPPQGWLCGPARGDRPAFTTCSFLRRCAPNLACRKISPQHPAVCYASCNAQKICGSGGQCVEEKARSTCMCKADLNCPNKAPCVYVGTIGQSVVGFCDRSQEQQCKLSLDCPAEHRCEKGQCVFDSIRANLPFPESWPNEKAPQDASAAPPEEPATRGSLEEPSFENKAENPRKPPASEPQPEEPPSQGCRCHTASHSTGTLQIFGLGMFGLLYRRRKRKKRIVE